MLTPTLISLLVGMVLAQRFKVLVLFPAILLTLFLATGAAIVRTQQLDWMLGLTALTTVVGLQVGYLAGIGVRHLTVLARTSRRPIGPLTSSIPPHRPADESKPVAGRAGGTGRSVDGQALENGRKVTTRKEGVKALW